MTKDKTIKITIYTKEECCLCDKAKVIVEKVAPDYSLEIDMFDITTNPVIFEKYKYQIPVIAINGEVKLVSKVSEFWLRRELSNYI
ncbi:MAG: glutaredoxin family protein [Thermincolia bacterium]